MASIAAREVGVEVLETLGRGKRPVLGKIALKKGYALKTSKNPKNITETKSYQSVISPLVVKLEEERDAIVEALKTTRSKAKYRDLIDGLDKITKNIQLLTGGATSNIAIGVRRLKDDELISLAEGS